MLEEEARIDNGTTGNTMVDGSFVRAFDRSIDRSFDRSIVSLGRSLS